jgi:hypothetical protein
VLGAVSHHIGGFETDSGTLNALNSLDSLRPCCSAILALADNDVMGVTVALTPKKSCQFSEFIPLERLTVEPGIP